MYGYRKSRKDLQSTSANDVATRCVTKTRAERDSRWRIAKNARRVRGEPITSDTRCAFLKRPEKQFVKLRPARSIKLVFPYVVKAIKIKITAKFRDMEHLRFEDTKRIMSHEKFRDFRETGPRSGVSRLAKG